MTLTIQAIVVKYFAISGRIWRNLALADVRMKKRRPGIWEVNMPNGFGIDKRLARGFEAKKRRRGRRARGKSERKNHRRALAMSVTQRLLLIIRDSKCISQLNWMHYQICGRGAFVNLPSDERKFESRRVRSDLYLWENTLVKGRAGWG
jgi:hypothetical protein